MSFISAIQDSTRLGLLRSRRVSGAGLIGLNAGYTVQTTWGLEGDFDVVRLIYENDTATSFTVDAAVIAAVAGENVAGNYAPVNASGSAVSWTAATFNGGGADTLPPSATGSTASVTVAGITGTALKAYTFSDWIRVPSTAPANGGSLRYLAVRTYSNSANVRAYNNTTLNTLFNLDHAQGRIVSGVFQIGDRTAATSLTVGGNGYVYPEGIQYYTRARGATVLAIGDSITQGHGAAAAVGAWGHIACAAVSRPGKRPVSFVNAGWGGQTSANYYTRGLKEIDVFRPEVVIIDTISPNDTGMSQATVDASFSRALDLAHYAISKGAVPILKTPTPWTYTSVTPIAESWRSSIVLRLRDMAATGDMLVLDADAVLRNTRNPPALLSAYDSGDGTHPNDAGNAALAAELVPILQRVIGA